jgi:alpha-tubulin suppressor-like RCC1 family protein
VVVAALFAASPVVGPAVGPAAPASAAPVLTVDDGRIVGGAGHGCKLRSSGTVWCWGLNSHGQLGTGNAPTTGPTARMVGGGSLADSTVARVAAGGDTTCAVDTAGRVSCWGANSAGQLGNDDAGTDSDVPVPVTGGALTGRTVVDVTVGTAHACALDDGGRVSCWGADDQGQLGDGGGAGDSPVPVAVDTAGALSGKTVTAITAGARSTCALDDDGKAYCWGDNSAGQLGNNDGGNDSAGPAAVVDGGALSGRTLTAISAGGLHVCALADNGKAYCWGENGRGQLGNDDATNTDLDVPAQADPGGIIAAATITTVAAGGNHTCVLTNLEAAWCWGAADNGQLGDNQAADRSEPVRVYDSGALAGATPRRIGAGTLLSCVTDTERLAYCWGDDSTAQLGNGTPTADSDVPARVRLAPDLPRVTVTPGDGRLTVSWPAPDPGTAPLTGYEVTTVPASAGCPSSMSTSCVITGLTNGTRYAVRVAATSGEGTTTSRAADGTPQAAPLLPITGESVAAIAGAGTVLLVAGLALVRYGRRRELPGPGRTAA